MLPAADSQKRFEFRDVARGVAAMLVLVEHGLHLCLPGYLQLSRAYIVTGQAALLVFFMISGFVIPMSLVQGKSDAQLWPAGLARSGMKAYTLWTLTSAAPTSDQSIGPRTGTVA